MPPPFTLSGAAPYTVYVYRRPDLYGQRRRGLRRDQLLPARRDAAGVHGRRPHLHDRTDGVSIAAGPSKTYIVNRPGGRSIPTSSRSEPRRSFFGRPTDVAAFDGTHYYAIANGQFTDTNTGSPIR